MTVKKLIYFPPRYGMIKYQFYASFSTLNGERTFLFIIRICVLLHPTGDRRSGKVALESHWGGHLNVVRGPVNMDDTHG